MGEVLPSLMDQRLYEIADTLAKDAGSGASDMMSNVMSSLLAIPNDELASIGSSEWERFALALHRAKPSVAPIFNIANAIMLEIEQGGDGATVIRTTLTEMMEREKRSGELIASIAKEYIDAQWLVTSSYSGTVGHVLEILARDRPLKVTVAESLPGGEGRMFAKKLSEMGIEAEVIHDSTVFARMSDADGAITGADSLTPAGLVNKVGTRTLAEAARSCHLPTYAVCGWSKACPVVLSDLIISQKTLGSHLSERIQIFESTPLDLISTLITDRGPMASEDLRMKLGACPVAKGWSTHKLFERR